MTKLWYHEKSWNFLDNQTCQENTQIHAQNRTTRRGTRWRIWQFYQFYLSAWALMEHIIIMFLPINTTNSPLNPFLMFWSWFDPALPVATTRRSKWRHDRIFVNGGSYGWTAVGEGYGRRRPLLMGAGMVFEGRREIGHQSWIQREEEVR